jgi:hypothetical protein
MTKKVFILNVLLICVLMININYAQPLPGDKIGIASYSIPKFNATQVLLVTHPDGGYVYGVNNDVRGFDGIAQGYDNDFTDIIFSEVIIVLSKKYSNNSNSKLKVTIYNTSSSGAIDENELPCKGPGTALGTGEISINDLLINTFTHIPLKNNVNFTGKIIVGIDITDFVTNQDTLAFKSDMTGNGLGLKLAFHHFQGQWHPTDGLFQTILNNNIAIFPVIAQDDGIEGNCYFGGIKASINPNPIKDNAKLSINFEKDVTSAVVEIFNNNGAIVKSINLNEVKAGRNDINLCLNELSAGSYYFSIFTESSPRYIKKFTIVK